MPSPTGTTRSCRPSIFLTAFSFVIVNLLVDLTYAWFDPRIRYR